MKLKTLNDIKEDSPLLNWAEELVSNHKKKIKAEAIKWVKEHIEMDFDHLVFVNDWIKHFFNITEEDLK